MHHLEMLFLSHNLIDEISVGTFDLTIHNLDLSYNNLTQLDPDLFVKTDLSTLSLSNNYISLSASNPFSKLQWICLNRNKLGDLTADMFSACRNMKRLYLSCNEIKHIDQHAFRGLKLHELFLEDNLFTVFDTRCIVGQNLQTLSLKGNDHMKHMRVAHPNVFKSLTSFDMSFTNLTKLCEFTDSKVPTKLSIEHIFSFFRFTSLKKLDLSHNKLSELSDEAFFKRMPALQRLSLSHNQLVKIHPDAFVGQIKLCQINLSHNQLVELHNHTFINQAMLCEVNLSHNSLTYLNIEHLFFSTNFLAWLDLSHNRLDERTINKSLFNVLKMAFDQINSEIKKLPVREKILKVKLENNLYDYEKDEEVMNELTSRYAHAFYNQRFHLNHN